jgi:hypothetical protein
MALAKRRLTTLLAKLETMRTPWHHNATLSIRLARQSKLASESRWRHDSTVSAHTVRLSIGRLRIIRFRPTIDHAKRLGLPLD